MHKVHTANMDVKENFEVADYALRAHNGGMGNEPNELEAERLIKEAEYKIQLILVELECDMCKRIESVFVDALDNLTVAIFMARGL